MLFIFSLLFFKTALSLVDTSGWVGAEYAPMQSSNEDWLYHYDDYASSVERELPIIKEVMRFTSLRVFLHSMIYETNSTLLLTNMEKLLSVADLNNFTIGFVFFDDCWNHDGFNLTESCQPVKGVHNGCWATSPQTKDRTSVDRYEPYVTEVVSHFISDPRVAWWEIFNEPNHVDPYSNALRVAGYNWAVALSPAAPILSCWDENEGTDLNDHHQYDMPWGAEKNPVYLNRTGRMQGGLVTEAGARWYQHEINDSGSPLTVIDWLTKLRKNPNAAFVPGVMINWEVMVSNSNTRWHWGSDPYSPEVTIPWHQHIFPDGTPVSYTEAGAIRRYITGIDDFIYYEDFLNIIENPLSDEMFHTLASNESYVLNMNSNLTDFLFETTIWFDELSVADASDSNHTDQYVDIIVQNESYSNSKLTLRVDATNMKLTLISGSMKTNTANTSAVSIDSDIIFDIHSLDCGLQYNAWNMVRLYINNGTVRVYFNPMFPDVFRSGTTDMDTDGLPLPGGPLVDIYEMPPRIETKINYNGEGSTINQISIRSGDTNVKIDYISVLPPILYGKNYFV